MFTVRVIRILWFILSLATVQPVRLQQHGAIVACSSCVRSEHMAAAPFLALLLLCSSVGLLAGPCILIYGFQAIGRLGGADFPIHCQSLRHVFYFFADLMFLLTLVVCNPRVPSA